MSVDVNTLCVVGAGTMGTGIAQVAAQEGIRVTLLDALEAALTGSRARLEASLAGGLEREKITPADADRVRQLTTWGLVKDGIPPADWFIEAVTEDAAVKRDVLRTISARAEPEACIATNTSTFCIADLAAHCERPDRFLGLHFFNPVPAMKLVEVVPGALTDSAVTEAAVALCTRLRKTPIVAPDIPGFLVNRVFAALVGAAVDLWASGAEPEAIDRAIELGLAHKLGPLRSADLVGLDVMLSILGSLHAQTGDARFAVPTEFAELVEAGKLGRKTGEGFYAYGEESTQ
jgi:3-hydroxybutyryl-CoA dehydrogenase